MTEIFARIVFIGIAATLLIDAWALALKHVLGQPSLDFRLVGRWVGHMPHGRFMHERIAAAAPVRGERALGWITHYGTGVGFAAVFVAVVGADWLSRPTPAPALIFGLATVCAPFFVMQPALGLGVAASKAPRPAVARARSLATHVVFGAGLYVAGLFAAALG